MSKINGFESGESITSLWQCYQDGLDYQKRIGIYRNIPLYIDFYEGRQWPEVTENTKNLPRPVVNIVKMICRNKKSAVLSSPVKIVYKSYKSKDLMEKFNSFASRVFKDINQEGLDKDAFDDAVKKGSYFFHYYWGYDPYYPDSDGSLMCELIDPLNIFFENPSQCDEQKQKWIMISSKESIKSVLQKADAGITLAKLIPDVDRQDNTASCREEEKVTVLTRYFRIGGEVYCERSTKSQIVNKPFPITPGWEEKISKINGIQTGRKCVATLYPIVCGVYERREKSIYGISEVEGIIPNQKAINFNIAMSLLNAQETAWGKYIALPNALKGQKISNVPGQVLIDYSGTGDGIKKMSEQTLSDIPMQLVNDLAKLTRNVTGASEVMTGEAIKPNMSGVAISQLQAQAQLPIEELKREFQIVKRKQGIVVAQFLKLFYFNREFIKTTIDKEGNLSEKYDIFSSRDYYDCDFDVTVEVIGSSSSVAGDISLLNTCLKEGKISIETYIRSYPDAAISNKGELLSVIESERSSKYRLLEKSNEDLKKELEKSKEKINSMRKTVEKVKEIVNENNSLKEEIASLYLSKVNIDE